MTKQTIESCFLIRLMGDDKDAIDAILDEDVAALAAIRAKRAAVRAICKTWTDAYEAGKDDVERQAVLSSVRTDQACDATVIAAKTAEIKASKPGV